MDEIKVRCIAAQILAITRSQPHTNKRLLESFCDKIYLTRRADEMGSLYEKRTLMEFKRRQIDVLSLRKVSNLEFKEEDSAFLLKMYEDTKDEEGAFKKKYEDLIAAVIYEEKNRESQVQQQAANGQLAAAMNVKVQETYTQATRSKNIYSAQLDEQQKMNETQEFFDRLIDAFISINFYNLLAIDHKAVRDQERARGSLAY